MKYSQFRPTGFDQHINIDDKESKREDWLVVPCSQNRDSEVLARANFRSALEMLGGEQEDLVEIHRFGHWANGWFEIIMVNPSLEEKASEIEAALENYPVLDSSLFSEMEEEERQENWKSWAYRDFIRELVSVFGIRQDATEDFLAEHSDALYSFHNEFSPHYDLDFRYLKYGERPNRDDLVKFIREQRKAKSDV